MPGSENSTAAGQQLKTKFCRISTTGYDRQDFFNSIDKCCLPVDFVFSQERALEV